MTDATHANKSVTLAKTAPRLRERRARRRVRRRALAGALLLAVAGFLALPTPAQADEVWSATMTVGQTSVVPGILGYSSLLSYGSLDDTTFTIGATTFTVTGVLSDQKTSGSFTIDIELNTALAASDVARLVYVVGTTRFALSSATVVNLSGSTGYRWASSLTLAVDDTVTLQLTTPPTVASVTPVSDPGADDTYGLGDTIEVEVEFNEAVTVTGMPRIQFEVGGNQDEHLKWATYARGTGTTSLRFTYVVQAGDMDDNGIWLQANKLELNGGTIQNTNAQNATLTYTEPGRQDDHKVDGSIAPDTTPPALESATVAEDGNSIQLTFDEPYDPVAVAGLTASIGFRVTADGSSVTSGELVFGTEVRMTLDNLAPAITHGQTVIVSYTDDPDQDATVATVQDAAGNDVASFTTGSGGVPAVVNTVPQPANASPAFPSESTTREVAENSPAGTNVGDPVTATDADDDTLTYTPRGDRRRLVRHRLGERPDPDEGGGDLRLRDDAELRGGRQGRRFQRWDRQHRRRDQPARRGRCRPDD